MRQIILSLGLCSVLLPAVADDAIYRCVDTRGTVLLTDRPCDPLTTQEMPRPSQTKERITLAAWEMAPRQLPRKPAVTERPRVDVETLRAAHQALDLRDKVASVR